MVAVVAFYHFAPLGPEAVDALVLRFEETFAATNAKGLVLVAPEGFNGTVSVAPEFLETWKSLVSSLAAPCAVDFKVSEAPRHVFARAKVDRRREIVAAGRPGVFPAASENHHLDPAEWDRILRTETDVVVVDTRNDYEVRIGKFRGAVDPGLESFSAWDDWVAAHPMGPDTKVLMYCTGGIRCEKAILSLQERGVDNVWQLRGGILGYLARFPEGGLFDGECFVFDERVAVDHRLAPTDRWCKCPHCGDPAERSAVGTCPYCAGPATVCDACRAAATDAPERSACSRNCAHHVRLGSAPRTGRTPSPPNTTR